MIEESSYEFAAERVVLELLGRGGFDSWWYDVDRDTRDEIKAALARTISNCFPPREVLADQPAPTETALCGTETLCGVTRTGRWCQRSLHHTGNCSHETDPRLAHALANPPGPRHARVVDEPQGAAFTVADPTAPHGPGCKCHVCVTCDWSEGQARGAPQKPEGG